MQKKQITKNLNKCQKKAIMRQEYRYDLCLGYNFDLHN